MQKKNLWEGVRETSASPQGAKAKVSLKAPFLKGFFFALLDVGVTDSVPSLFFRVLPRKSTNLSSPATASTRRSPRKTGRPTGSLVRSQTAADSQQQTQITSIYICHSQLSAMAG